MDGGEYASSRGPGAPTPARVSLAHLVSPSPRRLSGCFEEPSRPVLKKIAWVSLQGRLVGAEEATSAGAIGGGLSADEAVAWDLFSPLHRVLVVAVVAAAAYNSKRARQIEQFQRSVELRVSACSNRVKAYTFRLLSTSRFDWMENMVTYVYLLDIWSKGF